MGIIEWLDSALPDARYGLRQLRRTPALMLAVVLSLADRHGREHGDLQPGRCGHPEAVAGRAIRTRCVIVEWTNDGFPPGVENHNGEYRPIAGGLRTRLVGRRRICIGVWRVSRPRSTR